MRGLRVWLSVLNMLRRRRWIQGVSERELRGALGRPIPLVAVLLSLFLFLLLWRRRWWK